MTQVRDISSTRRTVGRGVRSAGPPLKAGLAVTAAVTLLHSSAWALCPNCLGQQRNWDAKSSALAVFLVLPLLVGYAVWRLIARWSR